MNQNLTKPRVAPHQRFLMEGCEGLSTGYVGVEYTAKHRKEDRPGSAGLQHTYIVKLHIYQAGRGERGGSSAWPLVASPDEPTAMFSLRGEALPCPLPTGLLFF